MDNHERAMITAAVVGAVIGVGQLLASSEPIKPRYAFGRAIVSSGLAVASFTALAYIPDASVTLLVGLSALSASLGSSGLTMLAQRFFGGTK